MKATRGGEEGLRAVRLADQVLRSLESHRWDGAGTPAPAPLPSESGSVLQGAHAWRLKSLKPSSNLDSLRGGCLSWWADCHKDAGNGRAGK